MSECMCIEVDVSDLRVATINSFEICALCSLPSVHRISTTCHKQGRESVNQSEHASQWQCGVRYAPTYMYEATNANMRRLDATDKGHALDAVS